MGCQPDEGPYEPPEIQDFGSIAAHTFSPGVCKVPAAGHVPEDVFLKHCGVPEVESGIS